MVELADIFRQYGPAYRAKFAAQLLPSQLAAMRAIEQCRTEVLGGHVYYCSECEETCYSYHSCRNRHCPKCQHDAAQAWLDKQRDLLLPVPYFLVTFTLPAGVRDAAMIALFKIAGLRRAEMAALNLEDYDREHQTLTVRGKRNKTRVIPIEDAGALDALADWLYIIYNGEIQPTLSGPLFMRITKGGRITQERLSDQGIYHILDTRRQQANMEPFTPHDLRRTFAGDLLDAGVDLSTVQKLMGHANANTTSGYDRRGERAKRDAVRKLHVPYQRRFAE